MKRGSRGDTAEHDADSAAASFAPMGELVVVDDGRRVQCHLCPGAYAFLPGHLPRHGVTAEAYRQEFGLGRSTSLCAPAVTARRRELGTDRYAHDHRLRDGLAIGQTMARSGELLELAHAAQPAGSARAQTRRRAGQRTAPQRRRTAADAADRLHARLTELGWAGDPTGYLVDGYHRRRLPVLALARELGVGNAKIARMLDDAGVTRRRPGGADTARARWRPRTDAARPQS